MYFNVNICLVICYVSIVIRCDVKEIKKREKKTNTVSKSRKYGLDMCKYSKMLLGVRYNERENNKIRTLGPNKVSVSP